MVWISLVFVCVPLNCIGTTNCLATLLANHLLGKTLVAFLVYSESLLGEFFIQLVMLLIVWVDCHLTWRCLPYIGQEGWKKETLDEEASKAGSKSKF